MEEDCRSWLPQPHFDGQPPDLNHSRDPQELGQSSRVSLCMNVRANVISANQTSHNNALPEPSHLQANGAHGWFYCLPRFRQAFTPTPSPGIGNKPSTVPQQDFTQAVVPPAGTESGQKRFLVFDQSGDQTTLIYSSLIGNPVQSLITQSPKPLDACHLSGEDPGTGTLNYQSGQILTDDLNENQSGDPENGLHEDTEGLNALLYSDDDTYDTEEDEETSTGHSPSMMMVHDYQEQFDSSECGLKRRKLNGAGFGVSSIMDTASSVKSNRYLESNDDAESSHAGCMNQGLEELVGFSRNKRMREEKIRKTVSALQSIIPGGKGKDAVMVLDEAIHYLKSLKLKALALGFKTL